MYMHMCYYVTVIFILNLFAIFVYHFCQCPLHLNKCVSQYLGKTVKFVNVFGSCCMMTYLCTRLYKATWCPNYDHAL